MSEQRTKLRRVGLALTAALGLIVGSGLSSGTASSQVEAPSVPGSPSAITFAGASSGAAPSPPPAAAAVPAPPTPASTPAAPAAAPAAGPLEFEQRLADLRYDVGAVNGSYDEATQSAVMAFQKVNGMERTGEVTPELTATVMSTNGTPPALVPGGGANRVEVDLTRQVLFLYEGDSLSRILPVSTGNGERFCEGGSCRNAVTPTGDFAVYRQVSGWDSGPLGDLYNPQYFNGGIAIHGAKFVPAQPASHGCVRIPMSAAEWFPGHVSQGTPVYVRG